MTAKTRRVSPKVQTTVARVASDGEIPAEVARYLAAENLPAELVMAPDPALGAIPWESRPLLHIRRGRFGRARRAIQFSAIGTAIGSDPSGENATVSTLWLFARTCFLSAVAVFTPIVFLPTAFVFTVALF